MTDKQQQFITEVQTGVIIRMLSEKDLPKINRVYEGLIHMDDAYYAAERIPEDITAHKAACQYLGWKFEDDEDTLPPSWALRH